MAKSRGGELISTHYINSGTKLRWRCAKGHEWIATPENVKGRASWCPKCGIMQAALKRADTIENMITLAKAKGGECLSKEYVNSSSKLRWRCAEGHEWITSANLIKAGRWCPKCAKFHLGRKYALTIEDMRKVAEKRGGLCLSDNYLNGRQKLLWRCAKGHEWKAIGAMVRHRTWCPICTGRLPKQAALQQLIELAKERGGELVSQMYLGTDSPLFWKCKCGNEWKATPHSIKCGSWCPVCSL